MCCGRNSLQVIHPVAAGRCNPLAVTPAKVSPHTGDVCSHLVPSHREGRGGRDGPCTQPVLLHIVFTIPRVPCEPGLGGEGSSELGTWGWNLGSIHRGALSSQNALPPCCPSAPLIALSILQTHILNDTCLGGLCPNAVSSHFRAFYSLSLELKHSFHNRRHFRLWSFIWTFWPFLCKYVKNIFFLMVGSVFF